MQPGEPRWLESEPPGIDELLDVMPSRAPGELEHGLRHQLGLGDTRRVPDPLPAGPDVSGLADEMGLR